MQIWLDMSKNIQKIVASGDVKRKTLYITICDISASSALISRVKPFNLDRGEQVLTAASVVILISV